jgi:hypothetical protein
MGWPTRAVNEVRGAVSAHWRLWMDPGQVHQTGSCPRGGAVPVRAVAVVGTRGVRRARVIVVVSGATVCKSVWKARTGKGMEDGWMDETRLTGAHHGTDRRGTCAHRGRVPSRDRTAARDQAEMGAGGRRRVSCVRVHRVRAHARAHVPAHQSGIHVHAHGPSHGGRGQSRGLSGVGRGCARGRCR